MDNNINYWLQATYIHTWYNMIIPDYNNVLLHDNIYYILYMIPKTKKAPSTTKPYKTYW
jgi:hypothetical protein